MNCHRGCTMSKCALTKHGRCKHHGVTPKRKNSRAKGARGELELAKALTDAGFKARRGQQFAGGTDSPDVICPDLPYHIEVKRVEAGNPYKWLAQAKRDAKGRKVPIVCHKKNQQDWIVIISLGDFLTEFLSTGLE